MGLLIIDIINQNIIIGRRTFIIIKENEIQIKCKYIKIRNQPIKTKLNLKEILKI